MTLAWCDCGKLVTFSNESRCEDCWAEAQVKFHGRSTTLCTLVQSCREGCDVPLSAKDRDRQRRNQSW